MVDTNKKKAFSVQMQLFICIFYGRKMNRNVASLIGWVLRVRSRHSNSIYEQQQQQRK